MHNIFGSHKQLFGAAAYVTMYIAKASKKVFVRLAFVYIPLMSLAPPYNYYIGLLPVLSTLNVVV